MPLQPLRAPLQAAALGSPAGWAGGGWSHTLGAMQVPTCPPAPPLLCLSSRVPRQVERIAQTEPAEVELPTVLRSLLSSIPKAVRSLGRYRCGAGAVRRRLLAGTAATLQP